MFVRENFLRANLADQNYILALSGIVFVEFTTSEEWNSPGPEKIRRNIVAWGARALLYRWDVTIAPRVERPGAAIQRNITADSRVFETWSVAQCAKSLLDETLTRCGVRILRNRQCDSSGPKIVGAKPDVLLTQTDETGDEQCCACEQSYGQRDLRANEDLAETLLTRAATGPPPAFFEAVNQVRVRTLQRRIKS